ncbi:MAG: DUF4145 domain-containing protein [Sulfurovum sp.]|nr:DUF4145 domain-containing protein [Sulfurovum sp.]
MIDRKLYKGYFLREAMNSWMCPTCNKGTLQMEKEKFIFEDNSITKQNAHNEDFNIPLDIGYTYTALLTCTNPKCGEVVTSSGVGYVDIVRQSYSPEGDIQTEYEDYFRPLYFYPPIHIFKIPEDTPNNAKEAIESSFSLLFNHKQSAANQVRVGLECLLTHLKIKRFKLNRRRKRIRLSLHERIDLLPPKYQHIKELCTAIKWLGNSGSHCGDEITFDDIFNGYDMLSFLLDEVYANRQEHAKKIAKKINAKKGV